MAVVEMISASISLSFTAAAAISPSRRAAAVVISSRVRPSKISSSASGFRLVRACCQSGESAGGTEQSSAGNACSSGSASGQVAVGSQPTKP